MVSEVLKEFDNEPFFTQSEISRSVGIDRKRIRKESERLGLGSYRFLDEGVNNRKYYSVNEVCKMGGFGKKMKGIIRQSLWTKSKNQPIKQTINEMSYESLKIDPNDLNDLLGETQTEKYSSEKLTDLRNNMGSIGYTNVKQKMGLLTPNEIESMFQVSSEVLGVMENEFGLKSYTDGSDTLYYFDDFMKGVVNLIDGIDSENGEPIQPNIPIVGDNNILNDINKLSSFLYDEGYRGKVLERLNHPVKLNNPIWSITENGRIIKNDR